MWPHVDSRLGSYTTVQIAIAGNDPDTARNSRTINQNSHH